ncbi:MAG: hypothetical protein RBS56_04070 [Candidatus Gracilibacteria bacterium]|jgi:DNA repair exonuclease SbcCD ATPase subunit|nr:hypothetical protein [Candidatus Gracilibacteria bacterium]
MIHDQIALLLQDLAKHKERLKDIKKDIKAEEKIENEQYFELKRAHKQMKEQVKEFEDNYLSGLSSDEHYNKLRELKIAEEEDIAKLNENLFKKLAELPPKPFTMEVTLDEMPVKIQVMPDMRLFVNGKEEKKRTM